MPRNPHKPGSSAATSFRADEIEALAAVLAGVQRGAHPRDLERLVRSEALVRVRRKVMSMQASLQRQLEAHKDGAA